MKEHELNPRTDRSKVSPEEIARLSEEMSSTDGAASSTPAGGQSEQSVNEFRCSGGAVVGWLPWSFPLCSLRADRKTLEVLVPFSSCKLAPTEVVSIRKSWLGAAVEIEHTQDSPKPLIFLPVWISVDDLLAQLGALGYPVAAD